MDFLPPTGASAAVFSFLAISNQTYAILGRDLTGDGSWTQYWSFAAEAKSRTISVTNPTPAGVGEIL